MKSIARTLSIAILSVLLISLIEQSLTDLTNELNATDTVDDLK